MSFKREGTSGQTSDSGNTTQQVTPQETEYSKQTTPLEVEARKAAQAGILQNQQLGSDLISKLLSGTGLPGYLDKLPGGIGPDITQYIVDQSMRDIQPLFQGKGLLDSGVNASMSSRLAGDIRTQAEQFNIQNLMQLLNLGVGGQAGIQQNQIGSTNALSARLAGLTPVTTTGQTDSNRRFNQATNTYGASFFKSLFGA